MTRKILAAITLAALFNTLFTGCSKMVNLKLYENNYTINEKIVGITLKDGSEITFDERGARYSQFGSIVSGNTPDGRPIEKTLRDVSSVKLIDPDTGQQGLVSVDAQYFHDWHEKAAPKNIAAVVTNQGETRKFKFGNARIDADQKAVLGFSEEDTWIAIPFDSVDHLRIRVPDGRKTTLLVVGCVVAFHLLAYALAYDDKWYTDPYEHPWTW